MSCTKDPAGRGPSERPLATLGGGGTEALVPPSRPELTNVVRDHPLGVVGMRPQTQTFATPLGSEPSGKREDINGGQFWKLDPS